MAKKNGRARSWLTRSYNFIDKDPECDVWRSIYQQEHIKEDDLAALAGLSTSTVKNLFGGQTRRPLHSTFGKLAAAMGYTYRAVRDTAPDYEKEIPQAKQERTAYHVAQRKKRERELRKKQTER